MFDPVDRKYVGVTHIFVPEHARKALNRNTWSGESICPQVMQTRDSGR